MLCLLHAQIITLYVLVFVCIVYSGVCMCVSLVAVFAPHGADVGREWVGDHGVQLLHTGHHLLHRIPTVVLEGGRLMEHKRNSISIAKIRHIFISPFF